MNFELTKLVDVGRPRDDRHADVVFWLWHMRQRGQGPGPALAPATATLELETQSWTDEKITVEQS